MASAAAPSHDQFARPISEAARTIASRLRYAAHATASGMTTQRWRATWLRQLLERCEARVATERPRPTRRGRSCRNARVAARVTATVAGRCHAPVWPGRPRWDGATPAAPVDM